MTLRRRVLAAIVSVSLLAIVLFAVPLAVAVQRLYRGEAVAQLQRDATRLAAGVPDTLPGASQPMRRPTGVRADLQVGVYRADGRKLSGQGPAVSAVASAAGDGRLHQSITRDRMSVSAPVPSDGAVAVTVRVASSLDVVTDRTERAWALMGGLATAGLIVAAVVGRLLSHRIARPLERLTVAATALGNGDFAVRSHRSGVREADAASEALERTARRLGQLLARERSFSRDVSHQLRTPLSGLLLGLESTLERPDKDARQAIRTALERARNLQVTVEDLLALSRPQPTREATELPTLLEELRQRWSGLAAEQGRQLVLEVGAGSVVVAAPSGAVRQVLDVLLDNAIRHGAGSVTVALQEIGKAAAIDVSDEGAGVGSDGAAPPGAGGGVGLPLARALAESAGGRLLLARAGPQPVFRLLLPTASDVASHPGV